MRNYFFKEYPDIYSKVDDLPPAKYNPGAVVKNSLVSSGCILNGTVENSVLFKKVYIGNNCIIKNSIILNDVYIGDNTVIENCIVESRDTIRANTTYIGKPDDVKIVIEKNERYTVKRVPQFGDGIFRTVRQRLKDRHSNIDWPVIT